MLKQNLSQRLLQKLSPQQIQLMKLLQIPTATLEQRIKEELEANPALEEGNDTDEQELTMVDENELYENRYEEQQKEEANDDYEEPVSKEDDINIEDYLSYDEVSSYKLSTGSSSSSEDDDKTIPIPIEDSFHEDLERQLGLVNLKDKDLIIAKQIIGSIDDDGYLRREPIAIVDDLAFTQNIFCEEEDISRILKIVQNFDPPGIGARDLRESLEIQLNRKIREFKKAGKTEDDMKYLLLAHRAISKYFNEFSKKHYEKLQRQLSVSERELKEIIGEILKLNPKPASGFASNSSRIMQYIVPDFIIKNEDGELILSLNSRNAPELHVSDHYRSMLRTYGANKKIKKPSKQEKEAVMFIKNKIDSAKWFIDAIKQRQQTMYKTMYSIMQFQYDYFKSGDQKTLRPMILKDIADITGLDISTVSRVANSKYVQTEFGTKRLKDFFSESLQTDSGEEVSTLEVKKILTELIDKENKRKPLSDEKLKNALQEKGYNIARRTVAKYREQLGIPVARLRKEL